MLNLNLVSVPTYPRNRKRWVQKIDIILASGILLQGMSVWATEIIDVNGPPALFKVQRGSEELWAVPCLQLAKGDKVLLFKPEPVIQADIDSKYGGKPSLTLKLDSGEIKKLEPPKPGQKEKNTPFPVESSVSKRSVMCDLKEWYASLWGEYNGRNVTKGSTAVGWVMSLPLLGTDSEPARLVAGKDSLHLVLAKPEISQPPYSVLVYRNDIPLEPKGWFVVEQSEIVFPNKEAGLPSLPISEEGSRYKVVVIGKDGGVREGVFTIEKDLTSLLMGSQELLKKLEAIRVEQSREEEKEMLIENLLAQNNFLLEAYQRVADSSPESGLSFFLKSFLIDEQMREGVWRKQAMRMEEELKKTKEKNE